MFGQIFGEVFVQVFVQVFWIRKYSAQYYRDDGKSEQKTEHNTNQQLVPVFLLFSNRVQYWEAGPPPTLPKTVLFHCTPPLLRGFSNQLKENNGDPYRPP